MPYLDVELHWIFKTKFKKELDDILKESSKDETNDLSVYRKLYYAGIRCAKPTRDTALSKYACNRLVANTGDYYPISSLVIFKIPRALKFWRWLQCPRPDDTHCQISRLFDLSTRSFHIRLGETFRWPIEWFSQLR